MCVDGAECVEDGAEDGAECVYGAACVYGAEFVWMVQDLAQTVSDMDTDQIKESFNVAEKRAIEQEQHVEQLQNSLLELQQADDGQVEQLSQSLQTAQARLQQMEVAEEERQALAYKIVELESALGAGTPFCPLHSSCCSQPATAPAAPPATAPAAPPATAPAALNLLLHPLLSTCYCTCWFSLPLPCWFSLPLRRSAQTSVCAPRRLSLCVCLALSVSASRPRPVPVPATACFSTPLFELTVQSASRCVE